MKMWGKFGAERNFFINEIHAHPSFDVRHRSRAGVISKGMGRGMLMGRQRGGWGGDQSEVFRMEARNLFSNCRSPVRLLSGDSSTPPDTAHCYQ
jgi:hypothetical protein